MNLGRILNRDFTKDLGFIRISPGGHRNMGFQMGIWRVRDDFGLRADFQQDFNME